MYSFEDVGLAIPAEALLDTSFVVEALLPSQPLHGPCRTFMEKMATARTVIYYNRLLEAEFAETLYQIALKERHRKDWKRYRYDGRARRRANALLQRGGSAWDTLVSAFNHAVYDVGEVAHRMPELMSRYGLASYDAIHIATAIESGVRLVVTLDASFASVPQSLVHTIYTNASRVRSCREHRP